MKKYAALVLAMALAGCAGAPPRAIPSYQPQDIDAGCDALLSSATAANADLEATYRTLHIRNTGNAAAVVGGLLFFPILFTLNTQQAQEQEIAQLEARHEMLQVLAARDGCQELPTMYVEQPTGGEYDPNESQSNDR